MTKRKCRRCGAALGVDVDICPDCGQNNPLLVPWYTWVLGPIMLALLAWFLIDFEALKKIVGID